MRKMLIVLVALALACAAAPVLAGTPGRFVQYPDISGNTIVFNWEHDLWMVPAGGGMATRLTTHPGRRERAEVLAGREADRLFGSVRGPEPVRHSRDGRRAVASHVHGSRAAGRRLDARRLAHRLPVGPREHVPADREALHRPGGRRPAGSDADGPRHPVLVLAGRHEAGLQPPRQRGVLLEALQGRPVHGHLALRLHGEVLRADHRLRRQERLPDVDRQPALLRVRPRQERHRQPVHLRLRDEAGRGRSPTSPTSTCRCRRRTAGPSCSCRPGGCTCSTRPRTRSAG